MLSCEVIFGLMKIITASNMLQIPTSNNIEVLKLRTSNNILMTEDVQNTLKNFFQRNLSNFGAL